MHQKIQSNPYDIIYNNLSSGLHDIADHWSNAMSVTDKDEKYEQNLQLRAMEEQIFYLTWALGRVLRQLSKDYTPFFVSRN